MTHPGYSVREIKEGYKGVIIDKNAPRKIIGLKIRTTTGHFVDVGIRISGQKTNKCNQLKKIRLENIDADLVQENDNVRVVVNGRVVLLRQQTVAALAPIIEQNFMMVNSYYLARVSDNALFDHVDIRTVSLSIVLNYLFMYNNWRIQYKRKKYDDLGFKKDDFDHPSTHDIIFWYFRQKYPADWDKKCSVLLGMTLVELRSYYERREQYYNK